LLDEEAGAATKANALEKFNSLFARDSIVEIAEASG
jgi:hypothetical protein